MTYNLNITIENLLIGYILDYEENPKEETVKVFFDDYIIYNKLVTDYEQLDRKYNSPNRKHIDTFYNLIINKTNNK